MRIDTFVSRVITLSLIFVPDISCTGKGGAQAFQPWLIDELVGNTAPDFTLTGTDGRQIELQSFRGSPVLLNFWATWCPYCRREREHLKSLYEAFGKHGLVIISVSIDRSRGPFVRFMKRNPAPYLTLHDTGGAVSSMYDIAGLPTTYLIGRDGIIKRKFTGFIPWSEREAMTIIEKFVETD
jgi:peroxiredoxin